MKLNDKQPIIYVGSLEYSLQFYVNALGFRVIYLNANNNTARVEFGNYKFDIEQDLSLKNLISKKNKKEKLTLYTENIDYLFSFVKRLKLNNVQDMVIDYYKGDSDEYIEKSFKIADPDNNILKFYEKIDLLN